MEKALTETEPLFGTSLADLATGKETGQTTPVLTLVTEKGGPFRSLYFEKFLLGRPEFNHIRTRVRSRSRTALESEASDLDMNGFYRAEVKQP